ncbi:hypothetical protein SFRURICE_015538, partial [Spodoptera frugiperda]
MACRLCAATTGFVATGIGHAQFEELFSALNVRVFSTHTYTKLQNEVYKNWELTAADAMQAALIKEKELAISEDSIHNGMCMPMEHGVHGLTEPILKPFLVLLSLLEEEP